MKKLHLKLIKYFLNIKIMEKVLFHYIYEYNIMQFYNYIQFCKSLIILIYYIILYIYIYNNYQKNVFILNDSISNFMLIQLSSCTSNVFFIIIT